MERLEVADCPAFTVADAALNASEKSLGGAGNLPPAVVFRASKMPVASSAITATSGLPSRLKSAPAMDVFSNRKALVETEPRLISKGVGAGWPFVNVRGPR